MKSRHKNIPVFIPHLGCPNDCVFCNQRAISGRRFFDEKDAYETMRESVGRLSPGDEAEIAFFGGSFTGIDRDLMIRLLTAAREYVESGRVVSVRCSTRPDYIDPDIIKILKEYRVGTVELGIQSTSDRVLSLSRRGHSRKDSQTACRMIKESGLRLGGQMMAGLPGSTPADEIKTANDICDWGADEARIYPTVVFRGTELCSMTERGEYLPLTNEEAAKRCADLIEIFDARGVKLLRVGLCSSENLASDEEVAGGPSHPAIGEKAMSEVFFRRICRAAEENPEIAKGSSLTVFVPSGCTSKAVGQHGRNLERLREKTGARRIKILEKSDLIGYNIIISSQ